MKAPRAVIAEDEANLRQELRETLAGVWPELVIADEAEDGNRALAALNRHAPDVLFLDIQMPGISGLDVARHASGRCHVVFVTAYDQYALAAFEAGAIDYVMKPFTMARLEETANRLKSRLGQPPADLDRLLNALAQRLDQARGHLRFITARSGDEIRLITVDEICYFQADNKYTRVILPGQELLIYRQIKDLLQHLDPGVFWQIHRSTIVNINAVAGVVRDIQGRLRARFKQRPETLPVSESHAQLFRHM